MPSSLAPLDPEILKENLPEDIQGIVDQMTANVNQAVSDLVQRFRDNANQVATQFQNGNFDSDLKAAIDTQVSGLTTSFAATQKAIGDVSSATSALATAAKALLPGTLTAEIAALVTATSAASTTLTNLQNDVNTVGTKLGGAIASSAVKLISGV